MSLFMYKRVIRMLRSPKAGALVKGIKNRVNLDPESHHVLLERFKGGGERYRPIVTVLEEEYRKQEAQDYCHRLRLKKSQAGHILLDHYPP
jgi:hypothetical protein